MIIWIPLVERKPPEKCPPILVTNNLMARNAYGHMSHVWLVSMIHEWMPMEKTIHGGLGLNAYGRFTAFDSRDVRLHNLTHWADPFSAGDAQPPVVPQWQPISTAPRDGIHILLAAKVHAPSGKPRISCGFYSYDPYIGGENDDVIGAEEGFIGDGDQCIPSNQECFTHWAPIPPFETPAGR